MQIPMLGESLLGTVEDDAHCPIACSFVGGTLLRVLFGSRHRVPDERGDLCGRVFQEHGVEQSFELFALRSLIFIARIVKLGIKVG